MADIPRRKIDTTAVIQWIRMVARSSVADNANATGYFNLGIINNVLQWVDSLGTTYKAAPAEAKYIVQTADSALTNEQALSSLSTGNVKVTTGTGVLSSVAWDSFYIAGTTGTTLTTYNGLGLTVAGATINVTGVIPSHVTTISKAEWWFVLLSATGNEQYDSDIQYGTIDEIFSANSASVSNQSIVQTSNNDIYKVSVLSLFSGVTANDVFGCRLTFDRINSGTLIVFGLYVEGA